MRFPFLSVRMVGLIVGLVSMSALARSGGKVGTHGGEIFGDDVNRMELKLDPHHSKIDVFVIKGRPHLPNSVGLTLWGADGKRREVELRAIELGSTSLTRYQGTLDPAQQSYVGFELRIPFHSEPPSVISSDR